MADKRERRPGELVFISILIGFSLTAAWQAYEISGFSEIAGAGVRSEERRVGKEC